MADYSLSQMVYPELKTTYRLNCSSDINFHIWKNKVDFVLFDNKVKYVLMEPIPDEKNKAVARKKFLDDDFRARHIILGCVHDDIYMAFYHHQSAKSLLNALTSFFAKPSSSKSGRLYETFRNYKMSKNKKVNEHLLKMRAMFREFELEGSTLSDIEKASFVVNSLPETETWEDLILELSIQLGSEKGLSLEDVEQRVRDWEEFHGDEEEGGSSGRSSETWKFEGFCKNCKEYGHWRFNCPQEVCGEFFWS